MLLPDRRANKHTDTAIITGGFLLIEPAVYIGDVILCVHRFVHLQQLRLSRR